MPRQLRIQYEGAVYHVMARGDRRENIFWDDEDKEVLLQVLSLACSKTGWRIHAWVLMNNHYHLVVETPKANLVDGMKWLQNTYTRRFNLRHGLWGHLFGGRYKAVLVETDPRDRRDYFTTLLDYVHLNPIRAGLIRLNKDLGLLSYRWSSLAGGYGLAPYKRPPWMECSIGLESFGLKDTTQGRKRFIEQLEKSTDQKSKAMCGVRQLEEQGLQSTLRRGWYWGSQEFREKLLKLKRESGISETNKNYRSSRQERDYGLAEAERLVIEGLAKHGLGEKDLNWLKGSDSRKVSIAREIVQRTSVSMRWIAERLAMKSAGNVSQQLYRTRKSIKPGKNNDK